MCSWEIRLFEVARGIPSSPFSVSSRCGARPYIRGLLYCSATHSQKPDGFRGLSDLLSSVGDDPKSKSGHIHFSVLFGSAIGHDAWKLRHLGQPSTMVSRSNTMLKDSPSGGWGTVAMKPPLCYGDIRSPQRLFVA